jgi:uncharacterized protein
MAKLGPYQVLLRDLPTHKTLEVGPDRVGEWLKGLPMRDALGAPDGDPEAGRGTADLELYADEAHGENAHVFANGTFNGWLTVACSRCVEPVKLEIVEQLRVTFMPKAEMPADDDEAAGEDGAEVESEDLDLFPYEGEVIDLEPLLREQFVLAIPYAPLCREDCKGLCGQCGTNKNLGACNCEAPIDPRLAALKGLKLPS